MNTRGYSRLQRVTGDLKGIRKVYRGSQGVTGNSKGLQGIRRVYKALKGIRKVYRGLEGYKGNYNYLILDFSY